MALEDLVRIKDPVTTFVHLLKVHASQIVNNIPEVDALFREMEPLIRNDPSISQEHKLEAKDRYNAWVLAVQSAAANLQTL